MTPPITDLLLHPPFSSTHWYSLIGVQCTVHASQSAAWDEFQYYSNIVFVVMTHFLNLQLTDPLIHSLARSVDQSITRDFFLNFDSFHQRFPNFIILLLVSFNNHTHALTHRHTDALIDRFLRESTPSSSLFVCWEHLHAASGLTH